MTVVAVALPGGVLPDAAAVAGYITKMIRHLQNKTQKIRLTLPLASFFLSSGVSGTVSAFVAPGFFFAAAAAAGGLPFEGGDDVAAGASSSSSSFSGMITSGLTTTAPPPLIVFTTGGGGGAADGGGRGSPREFNNIAFSAYSFI